MWLCEFSGKLVKGMRFNDILEFWSKESIDAKCVFLFFNKGEDSISSRIIDLVGIYGYYAYCYDDYSGWMFIT